MAQQQVSKQQVYQMSPQQMQQQVMQHGNQEVDMNSDVNMSGNLDGIGVIIVNVEEPELETSDRVEEVVDVGSDNVSKLEEVEELLKRNEKAISSVDKQGVDNSVDNSFDNSFDNLLNDDGEVMLSKCEYKYKSGARCKKNALSELDRCQTHKGK